MIKFDYEMFCASEDNVQTFIKIVNICCDLDHEHSNPNFSQDTSATMMNFRIRCSGMRQLYFDYLILHCDLDLEHSNPFFSLDWTLHTIRLSLVAKVSAIYKIQHTKNSHILITQTL